MKFSEKIVILRKIKGITQDEFAKAVRLKVKISIVVITVLEIVLYLFIL